MILSSVLARPALLLLLYVLNVLLHQLSVLLHLQQLTILLSTHQGYLRPLTDRIGAAHLQVEASFPNNDNTARSPFCPLPLPISLDKIRTLRATELIELLSGECNVFRISLLNDEIEKIRNANGVFSSRGCFIKSKLRVTKRSSTLG